MAGHSWKSNTPLTPLKKNERKHRGETRAPQVSENTVSRELTLSGHSQEPQLQVQHKVVLFKIQSNAPSAFLLRPHCLSFQNLWVWFKHGCKHPQQGEITPEKVKIYLGLPFYSMLSVK